MNQERTGKFISELRKQKGMTQKELAEQIGVSDKTISKWECGNSIPDISYLDALCNSLDVSVNELLSGERLSKESYSEKAEENIMALMKENKKNKRGNITQIFFGMFLIIMAFGILLLGWEGGIGVLRNYIDYPTLIILSLLCTGIVILSGKQTKEGILSCLKKTAIPSGVMIMLFESVIILTYLDDLSKLGPNLAVCILILLYSVILYIVVTIIERRNESKESAI